MKKSTKQAPPAKLADQVIARIQKDIASGKYKEGDRIPTEPELMELYSVGRSTIREAIKTLSNAGILKVQQGSGTSVMPQTGITEPLGQRLRRGAAKEVSDVRTLLEKEIVHQAVQNRTNKDLKAIKTALSERRSAIDAGDYDAVIDADTRFHAAIAAAGHNSVLADLYATFAHTWKDSFHKHDAGKKTTQFEANHKLHEKLLDALTSQSGKDAAKLTDQLIQAGY